MSIRNKFPIHKTTIGEGKEVRSEDLGEGTSSFGVLLNRSNPSFDWLDVRLGTDVVNISLNLVEGSKSTVVENAFLKAGETFTVGRNSHPLVRSEISRIHVDLTAINRQVGSYATKMGVVVADVFSTNGTSIWTQEEENRSDKSYSSGRARNRQERSGGDLTEIEGLEKKHGAEFPLLESIDYGILSTIIKSHPGRLDSRKDKLGVVQLIHPDRNITGDARRSHQLYILALKVLNIQL